MPVEIVRPNDFQSRLFQSFVNLTKNNSTTYPALTTVRIDYTTLTDRLTTYVVHDQYALRVLTSTAPAGGYTTI